MVETRFTIQFSRTDPAHLQVAGILNRQGRRSKAQYLVNAVLHYENIMSTSPTAPSPSALDVEMIEAVVRRLLSDTSPVVKAKTTHSSRSRKTVSNASGTEDLNYDYALDAIGQKGIDAITGALGAFRQK